jgi:hypothetical protein
MSTGDGLLYGTAWLSIVAWAVSEWTRCGRAHDSARGRTAFTLGLLALASHSLLAFHLRYYWSQAVALADTARQTQAVTGRAVAAGLFVNYGFLALWTAEVVWWWRAPAAYRSRAAALDLSVRAFFLFMFVNGAVVFASGPVRLVGLVATLSVAWAWYRGLGDRGRE